ncbi:MAG TPA: TadE family protein [Candidatus Limnocylindria bacterium]|nr:TadE family protein [Candidatus Limnocylindria bacterium]
MQRYAIRLPRPPRPPRAAALCAAPWGGARRGQALIEFAAVLLPLLLLVVGIIQLGLVLGANVTLTNAAREGARAATIHVYDNSATRASNDLDRCTAALTAGTAAFGFLATAAPQFSASNPCPAGGAADLNGDGLNDRWTSGDVVVSLCARSVAPGSPCPAGGSPATFCIRTDASDCLVRVDLTYRSPILVPLLDGVFDGDGDGLLVQRASAAMVVN